MVKAYERINWKNDQKPAINDVNLNKMDSALNEIDNRVVQLANETSPYENRFVNQTIPQVNPTIKDSADGKFIYMNNKGYTQQDGTPTPDAPIHISANGDKGYFDGALLQGGYKQDSTYDSSYAYIVCNKNPISCKPGDVVEISYEETIDWLSIRYWNGESYVDWADNNIKTTEGTFTVPDNVDRFYFNIQISSKETVTPSTAKHICVTINGQYALRVKTCNKNKLNVSTLNFGKSIASNGTLTANEYFHVSDYIPVSNGKTYYYSNATKSWDSNNYALYDKDKKFISRVSFSSDVKIVSSVNGYIRIEVHEDMTATAQFEEGTVATDYEPHQSSEALIPVSSPFYKGDYIEVYADGTGREYRKMCSVVYDGSDEEAWVHNSNNGTVFLKLSDAKNANRYVLCSHFKSVGSFSVIENNIFIEANGNLLICASEFSNATKWKTWLQSNPIHVVYELAEPTVTPLTAEQIAEFMKLRTYKGVTYVTADGEVVMRYYCNTDSGDSVSRLQDKVIEVDSKLIAVTIPFYNDSIAQNQSRTVTIPQEYLDEGYALVSILEKYKYYMKWEILGADTLKVTNLYEGDTSIYVPTVDVLLAKVK